jgi:hypothetical protein
MCQNTIEEIDSETLTLDPETSQYAKNGVGGPTCRPMCCCHHTEGRSRAVGEEVTSLRGLRLRLGAKGPTARPFDGGAPTLGRTRALAMGPTAAPPPSSISRRKRLTSLDLALVGGD